MQKQEAIELMQKGEKITHELFSKYEWMVMLDPSTIQTEDGYMHDADVFWSYRKGGYSIFTPQ